MTQSTRLSLDAEHMAHITTRVLRDASKATTYSEIFDESIEDLESVIDDVSGGLEGYEFWDLLLQSVKTARDLLIARLEPRND